MPDELRLTGLRYPGDGSVVAVDELLLGRGERTVLFGPNGAGKSTLLRLLAGTLPGGPDLRAAYLPQRPYAFRGSARRNLRLGLDEAEVPRAEALAGELGVAPLLDAPARSLSGGERQRLALARVLAVDAPLVLLDEPLAPLDLRDRDRVARIVAGALDGRTSLVVSHDRETVAILGERVAVLVDGRIHQAGTVAEVFTTPADDTVAAVVGIANVLPGVVERRREPMVRVRCGPVTIRGRGDQEIGEPVSVLFGAEAVSVHGDTLPAGSPRNVLPGTVVAIREVGRLREIVADCGVPVVALVTPGALDALDLHVGDPATLAVKATAVRVVGAPR